VVRADQQQDVLALARSRSTVADDLGDAALGAGQGLVMGRRAERHAVQGVVGIAQPGRRDRGLALAEHLFAEALGHRPVAGGVVRHRQRLERLAAGRMAAAAVIDEAVRVGIEEEGGARRDVRKGDEAAVVRDTL
jgi:hypothetical protein